MRATGSEARTRILLCQETGSSSLWEMDLYLWGMSFFAPWQGEPCPQTTPLSQELPCHAMPCPALPLHAPPALGCHAKVGVSLSCQPLRSVLSPCQLTSLALPPVPSSARLAAWWTMACY